MMSLKEEVETSQKKTKLSPLHHVPCQPCQLSFSSLPDELVVNCFARISKWYYPSLSLVSKAFRSLIFSPELYIARSQIGTTENCLYICLRFSTVHSMEPRRWFSLWVKPNRNQTDGRTKEKSSGNLFVPFNNSSPPYSSSTVTVGWEIYVFGRPMDDNFGPSSVVRVYDCRNNTWRDLPNMKMERKNALACVLDDKIYVMGGSRSCSEHSSWFEMFDIKTKTWKTLPTNPDLHVRFGNKVQKIDAMERKIYVKTEAGIKNWIYDVNEGRWMSDIEGEMNLMWPNSWCVIDNVMFCYAFAKYKWYDLEARKWRDVIGLQTLKKYRSCSVGFPNSVVELVNYDGKLAILWDRFERPGRSLNKNIWCAVVKLEKYQGVIFGKIEWVDVVLTVPKSYNFLRCLAISI